MLPLHQRVINEFVCRYSMSKSSTEPRHGARPATGFRYSNKCLGRLATHIWITVHTQTKLEQRVGLEPTTLQICNLLHWPLCHLYIILADSIGFEPMHPFRSDGLANRCLNHSANYPLLGGGCEIRTHGPFRASSFQDWCNRPLYQSSVLVLVIVGSGNQQTP